MKIIKGFAYAAMLMALIGCLSGCSITMKTNYVYQNGEKYTAGDREITEKIETIDVNYVSGDVKLIGSPSDVVSIKETSEKELDEKRKVHTWVDGTTLYVRYCASAKGLNLSNLKKHLEITIPEDVMLGELTVQVSSTNLVCENFEADNVKIHASSGDVNVSCRAKKYDLEASSGDVTLSQSGECEKIRIHTSSGKIFMNAETVLKADLDASSGSIRVNAESIKEIKTRTSSGENEFQFATVPEKSDIGVSSGNVTIYLPEKADLTADFDLSSGKLFYDLAFAKQDKSYVCGTGANQMKVKTSSGDVSVKILNTEN